MVLWVFGHARCDGMVFGNGDGLDDDDSLRERKDVWMRCCCIYTV
jgi:hypothetical protein